MAKVCPSCGFSNGDDAPSCLKCGYPLSDVVLAELPIAIGDDGKNAFTIQITGKSLIISRNDAVKVPFSPSKKKLNALLGISLAEFTAIVLVSLIFNFTPGIIVSFLVADALLLLPIQGSKTGDLSSFIRQLQLEGQRLFIMKYETLGNCNGCEFLYKDSLSELEISGDSNSCVIFVKDGRGNKRKFYIPNLNPSSLYNFLVRTAWREKLVMRARKR
ncbi:hypothetical protein [Stygiolobus caldivivus]|uniref:Zinc ribbon domain-containing protein n=1 Tax=Stygiolobus caldivivus TaxID=2824673 RepID=A0A8D5U5R7_9CREN|nr:hypothetical protein [Stygiolobus caldivivus]BCU70001.1 hypothetical protein KN1_12980 [Stygiolobus caldivivus]